MKASELIIIAALFAAGGVCRANDEVAAGPGGSVRWTDGGTSLCNLTPMLADRSWKFAGREIAEK